MLAASAGTTTNIARKTTSSISDPRPKRQKAVDAVEGLGREGLGQEQRELERGKLHAVNSGCSYPPSGPSVRAASRGRGLGRQPRQDCDLQGSSQ